MVPKTLPWTFVALWLAGCGTGDPFSLRVIFPDEQSRQETSQLVLVAIAPGAGASCSELVAGRAHAGDAGYEVEAQATLAYPLVGKPAGLDLETTGSKLFYVEAQDASDTTRLRGCNAAEVGADAPREVTIALQWVVDACQTDADCSDDGLWCTGTPHCVDGTCREEPPDCDDAIACTSDGCDEANDSCLHQPLDAACDDANTCTGIETCDPMAGCLDGVPLICDDGQYCNGSESCDPTAGCLAGTPPDCDDGVFCTRDGCDEEADSCTHLADDGQCDDGVPCTADACDPVDDACVHTPNTGGCPDLHIGPGPESCPHELLDGTDTTTCDYSGSTGLVDASLAAPLEGARFLLYDDAGQPALFEGPVNIPGGSWIGAAPGVDRNGVILFEARNADNGALHLAGDDIHVDGLSIVVLYDNEVAISSWPAETTHTGATDGHLIEHVTAFAIDQEVRGSNSIGPPVALNDDTTVRNCHFYGFFEMRLRAENSLNLRFVHNTFVLYQANDGAPLNTIGSSGFTFANNVVLSLAQTEPVLILADMATTDLVVTGNLVEGFAGIVTGYNPGDPGTAVTDNLLEPAEMESPRVPRFLADSTQRIAGPVPGEGVSLDGVDVDGQPGVYPGAYQLPSALGLPRRSIVRLGRGDCGGMACDLEADEIGQDIQEAVWSAWPGAEVQVFPSPTPYAGYAIIGWPLTLRGMGSALDEVVLDNIYDDDLLAAFDNYNRHDATLIVLEKIGDPVRISDLTLRLDAALSGDNWGIYSEDLIGLADRPPHRFERLKLTSVGTAAGLYGGFYLGARTIVQDSLVFGGYQACARLGPRSSETAATPPSNAKIVNLTCRLIGVDAQAPQAFLDIAAADGAVFANIAAESNAPIPLLRAQRRTTGDIDIIALDVPVSYQAVSISAKNASAQYDGFDDTTGSYSESGIELLDTTDPLFVDAGDSHLDPISTALDSGVDPSILDAALSAGISLDGVDRSAVQAIDRGCYEQGL